MICPRCENEIKYGAKQCAYCGLNFKYTQPIASKAKRSTAAIFTAIFGGTGLHNFYTGYFLRGTVRLVVFLLFCGLFVSPQIMNVISTGTVMFTFDLMGWLGIVSLALYAVSRALTAVEFVHLALGERDSDAKGFKLR